MADDDIRKQREDLAKEIKDVADKLKPKFRKLIKNIEDANAPLAKQVADIREASKGTYAGTLQAQKLANVGGIISDYIKDLDTSLDTSQLDQLQKVLGEEFDLEGFRESSVKVKQYEEAVIAATDARAERLAKAEKKENALGQMDAQIADLKEKQMELDGKALVNATKALKEAEEAREKKKKDILAGFDRELEEANSLLEKETKTRKEYNDEINTKFKELSDDAGKFGAFSDGLKKLTGFDLAGLADGVVESVNAFGKVVTLGGNQDLAGSILEGFQSIPDKFKGMTEGIGKGISNLGEGMGDGLKSLKGGIAGLGKGIRKTASGMMASAKSMGGKFIGILGKGAKMLGGFVKGLARGFMAAGKALMAAITPFIAAAAAFVGGLLMTAGSMLLAAAPYIAIGVGILAAAYMMYKAFMYLYENVEGFRGYIDTVVGFIMNIGQSLFDIFLGFKDMIVGIFTGDFDMVMEGLKGIFGGLWDLLLAPFKAIGDFFKNVFDIDIGKMLKDFAKKILPGWLVKRLFGDESSEPESAPAAAQRGLEDMDTQEVINERRAMENKKADYETIREGRERLTEKVQNEEAFKKMSEEDQSKMLDQIDKGKFDYKDYTLAKNFDLEEGGMQTALGVEGMASSDELKEREVRLRGKIGRRQRVLEERRDYVGERINPEHEGLDVEDIDYMNDDFDYGDRVKTARELKEEATAGMDKGMVNTVVNQVNNNSSQNNNTTMQGTPTATDNDGAGKLAGVPAFG